MYKIGIDVGGTTIKIGLIMHNKLIDSKAVHTDPKKIPYTCRKAVDKLLKRNNVEYTELRGVGVAFPGPVKDNIVLRAANLNLSNYDIEDEFKVFFPELLIKSTNDANAAALGEYHLVGSNHKDACMITLGTGIGGGIIIDGKVIEGSFGFGGEIGHIPVSNPYNFDCGCGSKGCIETVSSATGLRNITLAQIDDKDTTLVKEELSAKMIFDEAKAGDAFSIKIVDEWATYLADLCVIVSVTTNPSIFIIGGGVSHAGEYLLNKVKDKFTSRAGFKDLDKVKFTLASLGNDAGMLGAGLLI